MIITINNDNKVISKASGKIFDEIAVDNVTSFRVDKIPPTHVGETLFFDPETRKFHTEPNPAARTLTIEDRKAIYEANRNKEEALKWLDDNDWKINKRTLGEWSEGDERWLAYLSDRAKMRAKIDEAEAVLNG